MKTAAPRCPTATITRRPYRRATYHEHKPTEEAPWLTERARKPCRIAAGTTSRASRYWRLLDWARHRRGGHRDPKCGPGRLAARGELAAESTYISLDQCRHGAHARSSGQWVGGLGWRSWRAVRRSGGMVEVIHCRLPVVLRFESGSNGVVSSRCRVGPGDPASAAAMSAAAGCAVVGLVLLGAGAARGALGWPYTWRWCGGHAGSSVTGGPSRCGGAALAGMTLLWTRGQPARCDGARGEPPAGSNGPCGIGAGGDRGAATPQRSLCAPEQLCAAPAAACVSLHAPAVVGAKSTARGLPGRDVGGRPSTAAALSPLWPCPRGGRVSVRHRAVVLSRARRPSRSA